MLSTVDKAIAGGVVSFLANWLLVKFNIHMPIETQTALSGLIVAVIVWVTPNVEKVLIQAQTPSPISNPEHPKV